MFMPVFMAHNSSVWCYSKIGIIVRQRPPFIKHLHTSTPTGGNPWALPSFSMEQINSRSIFSPATGFIQRGGFDWTCNPYVGCSFGCTYCYAMFLPQNRRPKEDWGKWFQAKINAVKLAKRQAPKVAGQAVYLSSV